MPISSSQPVRFTPRGLVDAYDSTDTFPGACRKLQNLVFDPSNPECVIARPGVGAPITTFSGLTTPGFISVHITIGNMVYGMIATGRNAGQDEPFAYNLSNGTFTTITGITSGNSPTSPSTTGAWTPPTVAVVGTYLIITHSGYPSTQFGALNLSTNAYSAQTLGTHALPSTPTAVTNLNNRAYFACGNAVYYSDVLSPLVATTAGQSLTLGDSATITALSGLPVQTTSAGVVSALLVFKTTQIWQVTGDAAITNSLALNYLSLNIGTACPRSVSPSPLGTFFVGPDSAYVVSPMGGVMPVTSQMAGAGASPDLRQPFGYVTIPSRVSAAFASNIYRVCLPTIIDGAAGIYDYWFDTRKLRWNGPHTFNYDCVSSAGNYFIVSGQASGAALFNSVAFPSTGTPYLDNGATYAVDLKTAALPKEDWMSMKSMIESTLELTSVGTGAVYTVIASDDGGGYLASSTIQTPALGATYGVAIYGLATYTSSVNIPITYKIPWSQPVVFSKLTLEVTCTVQAKVGIGTFFGRFQKLGYTL